MAEDDITLHSLQEKVARTHDDEDNCLLILWERQVNNAAESGDSEITIECFERISKMVDLWRAFHSDVPISTQDCDNAVTIDWS
jgi:hypothetical protein